MEKKIHLTESQFREYMRFKLHEDKKNSGKKVHITEEQMRNIISNALRTTE